MPERDCRNYATLVEDAHSTAAGAYSSRLRHSAIKFFGIEYKYKNPEVFPHCVENTSPNALIEPIPESPKTFYTSTFRP